MVQAVPRSKATAASFIVIAAIVVSAFVLNSWFSPQSTPTPSSSSYAQTSTATKFAYTDVLSQGNLSGSIVARENEVFIIHLAANTGSTGYDWNVTTSGGVRYLNYTTTQAGTLPGAPSQRDYFFKALTPGAATITLLYARLPPAFSIPQIAGTVHVSVEITP